MNIPYLPRYFLLLPLLAAMVGVWASPAYAKSNSSAGVKAPNNRQLDRKNLQIQRQEEKKAGRPLVGDSTGSELIEDKKNNSGASGKLPIEPKKNRLTPDERRALRRQIQDAGQEIYQPTK